jgi:hypothetical protein
MMMTRKQNGMKYILMYYLGICVRRLNKPKNISMRLVQDLNAGPFEYEAGVLTIKTFNNLPHEIKDLANETIPFRNALEVSTYKLFL